MAVVMVVEDNEHQLEWYERELAAEGYEVLTAKGGNEALRLMDKQMPDCVVMDISMPGMDGIDAMSRMLGKNHRLPIILNTAYPSYKDDFRACSADACIIKSSSVSELKSAIQRVLKTRSSGKND